MHVSTPCLLNSSQLSEVSQIRAGDSYSAAVTGEPGIQNTSEDHCLILSFLQMYYYGLKALSPIK